VESFPEGRLVEVAKVGGRKEGGVVEKGTVGGEM